jgi:hypothetical protein
MNHRLQQLVEHIVLHDVKNLGKSTWEMKLLAYR